VPARLLVVAAGSPIRHGFFLAAARGGIKTVLVDDNPYNRYDLLADDTMVRGLDDPRLPAELAAMAGSVDGVTSLSDRAAPLVDWVARECGLPAPGRDAARAAHDKEALRRLTTGVLGPLPWDVVHDDQHISSFFEYCAGPAVMKPVDAAASLGVAFAANAAEAKAKLQGVLRCSPRGHALIEAYVPGPEFSFEVVVRDGAVTWFSTTEKTTTGPPRFLERQHVVERDRSPFARLGASTFLEAIVDSLGVENAVMHVEAKLADQGWTLLEAAVRPAGGLIPEITEAVTGVNLYDSQLSVALGAEPREPDVPDCPVAGVRFVIGTGTVRDAGSMAPICRDVASLAHASPLLPAGVRIGCVEANWRRAGYVLARGTRRETLLEDLLRLERRLTEALGLSDGADSPSE
jgi:biotin carboxylase